MSVIKEPVMLDKTGRELIEVGKSIAEALWTKRNNVVPSKAVNFYDYDGTRVYSYSKAEFLGLSALPGNPAHDGLTAQGWNWDLTAAKAYVQKYDYLDIGQVYVTDDGKTRLYVEIDYTQNLTIHINYVQSAGSIVTIDWGDGNAETSEMTSVPGGNVSKSHTYSAEGNYIVTIDVADGTIKLGTGTGSGVSLNSLGGTRSMFFYQGQEGRLAGKDALVAVEIGEGVTDIGGGAFGYMTRLQYIIIPNNVEMIRDIAFYACIALKAIIFPSSINCVGNLQHGFNYNLKVLCLPPTIATIGQTAFKTCTELERLCIPEGVTTLSQYVCYGLHTAKEIVLPDTIAGAIPNYAFGHCYGLQEINIPVGVTSIGQFAFTNCHNLRKCDLPEGVTTIANNAFTSCFAFIDFVIPSTVTAIGSFAFLFNDGTHSFIVKPTNPPTLEPTAFTSIYAGMTIYVPYSEDHSILDAYKAATGWASKADNIVEEDAPAAVEGGE